jgi:hypothetical protein
MRYREVIDRAGRIVDVNRGGRYWLGAPAYLYRELFEELCQWSRRWAIGRRDEAFVHECLVRYLLSYLRTRRKASRNETELSGSSLYAA